MTGRRNRPETLDALAALIEKTQKPVVLLEGRRSLLPTFSRGVVELKDACCDAGLTSLNKVQYQCRRVLAWRKLQINI